jgi:hypothetical protein
MAINDANQASATISLSNGTHVFRVFFNFNDTSFGTVLVAEIERSLNVVEGSNILNLSVSDYSYPDSDNDNFSNLAEVKARTDPNDPNSTPQPNKVFVTSVTGTGDLSTWAAAGGNTGLAAADAVCQSSAKAAGLTGTFRAWMSDANDDAYCRIHNLQGKKLVNCGQTSLPVAAGPWVRTDAEGFPYSEAIESLVGSAGVVYSPLRFDEFGERSDTGGPNTGGFYLTGTDVEGRATDSTCTNWTNATSGNRDATAGTSFGTTKVWTQLGSLQDCGTEKRLACFQTGEGGSLPNFTTSGKKVFYTSTLGNGNLGSWDTAAGMIGIEAGDAICQAAAKDADLANAANFKAWLSGSTTDAIDRLTSDGLWVRIDGVKVADNKVSLLGVDRFSSISQDEKGNYGNVLVWTGTDGDGKKTTENCTDWIDSTNVIRGTQGLSADMFVSWTNLLGIEPLCSGEAHLYCFED